MLEGYIVLLVLHKLSRNIIERCSKKLAIALLCVHIIGRWILIIIGIKQLGEADLYATYCVRNVWFDALPFLLLGYDMHKNKRKSCEKTVWWMIIGGLILSIIEFLILNLVNSNVECVLYIGTIIASCGLIKLSILQPALWRGNIIEKIGDKLSSITYFIHVEVESVVTTALGMIGFTTYKVYEVVYPILIVSAVLVSALIIVRFQALTKKIRLRED